MSPYNEQGLRDAGFSDAEIEQDKSDVAQHLNAAGFSGQEVNGYFGKPPTPNMKPIGDYAAKNLASNQQQPAAAPAEGEAPKPSPQPPRAAESMLDALEAGFQMSTTGLIARNKLPDTVLPENAGMAMRIVSQAGTLAGDLPAMVAGGVFGGAAGSEVPIVGTAIGGAAGAWAAPAAIRSAYIDHLQKGNVKDFGDFWERSSGAFLAALKAGTTGALTEGVGGAVAGPLASAGVSAAGQTAGKLTAQLATMTTVGKAMEGQIPKPEDFLDGALLLAGLHGAVSVATEMPSYAKNITTKLQDIYAQTGIKPDQVFSDAQTNPVVKQELLSSNKEIPSQYKTSVEEPQPGSEGIVPGRSQMQDAQVPKGLGDQSNVLGKDFNPEQTLQIEKPPESKGTAGGEPPDLSDPKAAVLDRIGEEREKPATTLSQIYTKALDDLNPVKQLTNALSGGEKLEVGEDPFKLMRLSRAATGKAELFVDHGPIDYNTLEPTGAPGLKQILQPFKGDLDGFKAYAIAQRAIELQSRGIETGVPIEQAKALVDSGSSKYEKGFRQLVDFQNASLKYLKDAGILSEEAHDTIVSKNKNYLPFTRISESGEAGGAGRSSLNPIKSIGGSELKIADPIESIIKNTFAYMKVAEKNRAVSALVDLAEKSDVQGLVQKVPTPLKPIEVRAEEVARFMKENGIQGDPDSFTIFRAQAQQLAKDEIAVMRNGKREVYNVGEDVAKALNATDYQPPNTMLKAISIPAKMIRTGAVETIDFLSRHFIRDQVNATVLSDNGYVPVIDALRGLKSYFTEDETYQRWQAGGGGMANIVSLDRDYIQSKIFELSKETGLIDKATNVLKNPLEIMRAAAEAITSAPRIGEFAKAQAAGKDIQTAAYDARNVTIDNQRMGSDPAVRAMSLITAFWNTHIQGVDRLVQAFKDKPVETATKMSLAVTLPSVLLWAQNHDDPRYQNLERWQKDLFWIVLTKDHIFRIPKPFEQGILFGSSAERMLDSFYAHNPNAFKGFGAALMGGALPTMIPTAFMPALEQFANRSYMTGGNIVPHSLEDVAPAYQYNPYTSETAKILGKMTSAIPGVKDVGHGNITLGSPLVIQNYVRSWGGSMGMYALQIADKALEKAGVTSPPPRPTADLADIPVIKAFVVRYPGANSQYIQDFYDNFQKTQTSLKTVQHLAKSGDINAAEHYLASPEAQESMVNLTGIEKALGAQNRMIQLVYSNPTMNPDEKRQQIDGLYYQMIQAAKTGNQMLEQVEKMKK